MAVQIELFAYDDAIITLGGPEGLSDKKIVALIAYLQRLGTDIDKPEPAAVEEDSGRTGDTGEAEVASSAADGPEGAS